MQSSTYKSLADKLAEQQASGLVSPIEALSLVQQITDALLATSPSIAPLRPENILFTAENTIQLSFDTSPLANPAPSPPMLDYAPPELLVGKDLTEQSTIYSLGIILYELLAGHRPHLVHSNWDIFEHSPGLLPPETPLEEVRGGLTAETYQLVHTCLRREAWGRYESLTELREALGSAITAESRPPTFWEKIARYIRWPVAAFAGMIMLGVLLLAWRSIPPQEAESATADPVYIAAPLQPSATPSPTRTPAPTTIPPTTPAASLTATAQSSSTPSITPSATPTLTVTAPPTETSTPTSTASPEAPFFLTFDFFSEWERHVSEAVTFEQSFEQAFSLPASGKLSYNFQSSGNEFSVFLQVYTIGGTPEALQIWVLGDGSGHYLNASIEDNEGQLWQVPFGRITHIGWILMTGRIDVNQGWPWESTGGPNNGRVDYPIRFRGLVLDDFPDSYIGSGAIYVDDLTAVTVGD